MKTKSLAEGPIEVEMLGGRPYAHFWWEVKNPKLFGLQVLFMKGYLLTKQGAERNWERLARINHWENWKFI